MNIGSIRYGGGNIDFRYMFMKLCGYLQKTPVVVLDSNPQLCHKLLKSSHTKGHFVENLLAQPAWLPILSIESTDGPLWQDLTQSFRQVFHVVPWAQIIEDVCRQKVLALLEQKQKNLQPIVDGEDISRCCAQIFYQAIFSKPLDSFGEDLYYQASLTWRKEIALKGHSCLKIKTDFVEHLKKSIIQDFDLSKILDQSKDPLTLLSAIAQPFLISPQINFSDILATLFENLRKDSYQKKLFLKAVTERDETTLNYFMYEAIWVAHPFPVLERYLDKDFKFEEHDYKRGCQIFIVLDTFKTSRQFNVRRWEAEESKHIKAILFGAGLRVCPGRHLGLTVLKHLVVELINNHPFELIQPYKNHRYSGRSNDHKGRETNSFYQAKIFANVIWASFLKGLRRNK